MNDRKSLSDLDFHRLIEMILDYAVTLPGKQKVRDLKPLREHDRLLNTLETVAEMQSILESGKEDFNLDFYHLDEEMKILRIEDSFLDGAALNRIAKTIESSTQIRNSLRKKEDLSPHLWEIARELSPVPGMGDKIRSSIDESGEVKDSATPKLGSLRNRFQVSRSRVLEFLDGVRRKIGPEIDTAEGEVTLRNGRYVVPLRVGSHVKIKGIVHDRSRSGATQFIEPQEAVELNNNLREVELEIYQEINTILKNLSSELRPYIDDLLKDQDILGEIDSIRARARFSVEYGCSIPEVTLGGPLKLSNARHPLLGKAGDERIVPLDLELDDDERSLLISGPNAGGKTVLLKTVGLLILMAHYGIPPSLGDGSTIPFLESVFTDIGDDQSIENDLSTFSSKIKVLKEILANADKRSMVLLDEVGSGTDPTEGQALALTVIEELTGRGSINIFTTHYSEVKGIAGEVKGVVNGSLGFDSERIEPTYRFRKGVPGRSYGLDIAERLGLLTDVVERARKWVPSTHQALDELIDEWEKKRRKLLSREEEIGREKARLSATIEEWEKGREEREKELEAMRRKADEEVHRMVLETRNRMEEIISSLEGSSGDDKDGIKAARREVEMKLQEIREDRRRSAVGKETVNESDPLRVGDSVEIVNLGEEGTILAVKGSEYIVKVGNLSVSMPRETLKTLHTGENGGHGTGRRVRTERRSGNTPLSYDPKVAQEIDIRGLFAEEVLFHVQKAIDSAILQGFGNIRFIHGKGKGVLREKVAEVLRSEKRVKSFRAGQYGEGGSGVTVATIM
jgi:DNA mismatch repair protein MutS2